MSIKIETKKVVVRGEQFYKIIAIKALTKEKLPEEYSSGSGDYNPLDGWDYVATRKRHEY